MCYNINMRAFHPLKRSNALYRLFPDYKDYQRILKVLQDFTYDVRPYIVPEFYLTLIGN